MATLLKPPAIYLIAGIPGAGKTTVSRLLAGRFERGAHVEGDAFQRMIVSGGVWPGREFSEEAERQLRLRVRNACVIAASFFDAGFTPVVDDVLISWRLADYRAALGARPLRYVLLLPNEEAVRRRNAARPDRDVFETWRHLDQEVRRTSRLGLWLDTTAQIPEETVDEVLRRLDETVIG